LVIGGARLDSSEHEQRSREPEQQHHVSTAVCPRPVSPSPRRRAGWCQSGVKRREFVTRPFAFAYSLPEKGHVGEQQDLVLTC